MGEAVKLDFTNFVQAGKSVKTDNSSSLTGNSKSGSVKSSFTDILRNAGTINSQSTKNCDKNDDSMNSNSCHINNEQSPGPDILGAESNNTKVNQKNSENKESKNINVQNKDSKADDVDNAELTDEQKEELNKVKRFLEDILSGTEGSDKKIDALMSKIIKLMNSSENADVKKEDASKLSDNIFEEILSSLNVQNSQASEILGKSTQGNTVSGLKQDLNTLISMISCDTEIEKAGSSNSNVMSFLDQVSSKIESSNIAPDIKSSAAKDTELSADNTASDKVSSSQLKVNQMLTSGTGSSDEENLLIKIKNEIKSITDELKQTGSKNTEDISDNISLKNNNGINGSSSEIQTKDSDEVNAKSNNVISSDSSKVQTKESDAVNIKISDVINSGSSKVQTQKSEVIGSKSDAVINSGSSQTQNQNDKGKQENSSLNNSRDDKFLNNLLDNNSDSQSDKVSRVTNLFNQFSINNADQTSAGAETPVINSAKFSADIIKSLKYMENNNIKDLTIKIVPKELGEVIIKLTSDGGIMKASITATNKEAYGLLNSNLQDLNNSLNNQNIKIQNVNINIYNEDTTFFSENNSKENSSNGKNKKNKGSDSLAVDKTDNVSEADNLYEENEINALA